jgi:hypothetical protein
LKVRVIELTNSHGPHHVEGSTNYTNKDLEEEDEDNLHVSLGLKLGELSSGFAGVFHNSRVVTCVNY